MCEWQEFKIIVVQEAKKKCKRGKERVRQEGCEDASQEVIRINMAYEVQELGQYSCIAELEVMKEILLEAQRRQMQHIEM